MAKVSTSAVKPEDYVPAKRLDRLNAISGELFPKLSVSKRSIARSTTLEIVGSNKAGRTLSPIYLDDKEHLNLPMVLQQSRRRRIAFGWYGGKFNHLDWLLPLLPKSHHYCEPFSGSASVLLNREPSPVETYNDIDGEVVNFFRVLRDQNAELERAIALTPFSREEFHKAIVGSMRGVSDLERARRFYIKSSPDTNRIGADSYTWSLGKLQGHE